MERKYTPERIETLGENEIFVFGSNLMGAHGGGAARAAFNKFGAVWGQGVGLQGQSYAIPTMQGGVETIAPYVDEFISFASAHPELYFWVTRIGCGIAGFKDEEIAPLFAGAYSLENVALPKSFCDIIESDLGREALSKWTNLNLVKMNRVLCGQDPCPPKTEVATADSWETQPMPKKNSVVKLDVHMSEADFKTIEMGHIPDCMEDHWFMYCEPPCGGAPGHIRWYRSWTGLFIFDASYERRGADVVLVSLTINRDPAQFKSTDDIADTNLFLALMADEIGADPDLYWQSFWSRTK